MKIFPTTQKINKIKDSYEELPDSQSLSICQVASALGLLISNLPATQIGSLHFQYLDMDKSEALKQNKGNFDH